MNSFRDIPTETMKWLRPHSCFDYPRRLFRGCPLDALLNNFVFACNRYRTVCDVVRRLGMCAQLYRESGEGVSHRACLTSLLYRAVRELDRLATEPAVLHVIDRRVKFVELFALALGHTLGLKVPTKVSSRGWVLVNAHKLSQVLGVPADVVLKIVALADFDYTPAYGLPDDFKNVYSIAHSPGHRHWRAYRIVGCADFLMLRVPAFVPPGCPAVAKDMDTSALAREVTRLHDLRDAVASLSVCLLQLRLLTDEEADGEIGDYYKHLPAIVHGLILREPYVRRELFIYLGVSVRRTHRRGVFTTYVQHMQFSRVVFNRRGGVRYADGCALLRAYDDYLGYGEEMPLTDIPPYLRTRCAPDDEDCWWTHPSCRSGIKMSCFSVEGYSLSFDGK
jgi:hypothetical protein